MRIFLSIVGLAVVAVLLAFLWATRWSKISREALIEQYRLEDSRFIEVDGVELHVRDIGSGPVVLLLHGHAGNLRMWDAWTDALSDAYRVISFDIPGYGLTSPDPSSDYSVDRTAQLAMGLMDEMGIGQFYAGGTSIGSIAAFRMTSRHAERIPALILANAAGLPREPGKGPNQPDPNPFRRLLYKYHFPYGYFENFYQRTWHDPSKAPDELVRQYYDMARRVGAQEEGALSLQQYRDRAGGDYAAGIVVMEPVADPAERRVSALHELSQECRSGVPRLRESGPYPADRGRRSVGAGRACLPGSAGAHRKRVRRRERGRLALDEGGTPSFPAGMPLFPGFLTSSS